MINYTRISVNLCSFFVTIILMWIIYLFPVQTQSFALTKQKLSKIKCSIEIDSKAENKMKNIIQNKEVVVKTTTTNLFDWKISIPAINLEANIAEGTSQEVMNKYVGHFENTPKLDGNIALGAHNRGYSVNYFQDLKKLKKGDIIQYTYGGIKKSYKVDVATIIKDTDWTYLQNTTKDKITLITCVENQPEYRRCIQGVIID